MASGRDMDVWKRYGVNQQSHVFEWHFGRPNNSDRTVDPDGRVSCKLLSGDALGAVTWYPLQKESMMSKHGVSRATAICQNAHV
jgi:hypothetical protein